MSTKTVTTPSGMQITYSEIVVIQDKTNTFKKFYELRKRLCLPSFSSMLYGEKTSSGYWFLNPEWLTTQEMNWLEGAKSVDTTCMQQVEGLILRFDPRQYPNFLQMLVEYLKQDHDIYKGKLPDGSPFIEVVMNIPHHIAHFWFCINGVIDGDVPAIKIEKKFPEYTDNLFA